MALALSHVLLTMSWKDGALNMIAGHEQAVSSATLVFMHPT